jgi:hypothetical protein
VLDPKTNPNIAGLYPRVDLYIVPVTAPQSAFFYVLLNESKNPSKKKFIVLPVRKNNKPTHPNAFAPRLVSVPIEFNTLLIFNLVGNLFDLLNPLIIPRVSPRKKPVT